MQPYSDSPVDDETVSKNVYLDLITQAQETLWITTPYLILDNATMTSLRLAAKRGVDVRIYTPGIPDKKMVYQLTCSYFEPLIRSGVKMEKQSHLVELKECRTSAPGLMVSALLRLLAPLC